MRRLLLSMPLLLMPFIAAGQTTRVDPVSDAATLQQSADAMNQNAVNQNQSSQNTTVSLLQDGKGHTLAVNSQSSTTAAAPNDGLLSFAPLNGGTVKSNSLQYGLSPNLNAHIGISQQSWVGQTPQVIGSEVGATYSSGRYSLGLSVAQDQIPGGAALPRVLPGAVPGVNGLADFDSSTRLSARGRLALTGNSGIVVGASMGRVRLLPGNLLGLNTLDQKALSFGIDHGSISGNVIGRTMQPEMGVPSSFSSDRRWNSIDLGVTWRLPWQGSLSFGAQNVWSSGNTPNTPAGPEPDQSRTPYVQYHQDL
jgi:hypothetical protein